MRNFLSKFQKSTIPQHAQTNKNTQLDRKSMLNSIFPIQKQKFSILGLFKSHKNNKAEQNPYKRSINQNPLLRSSIVAQQDIYEKYIQQKSIQFEEFVIPVYLFLVGDAEYKDYKDRQRQQSIMQIFQQQFYSNNRVNLSNNNFNSLNTYKAASPKRLRISDVRFKFEKALNRISIKQIIQSKYKLEIDQWRKSTQPKLFILMVNSKNLEDIDQINKFLKDVQFLYSRKTVNIKYVRQKKKHQDERPLGNNQQCNWVTGILINDVGDGKKYNKQIRHARNQCLLLCKEYKLLYLQTNPDKLKQNNCNDIFLLASTLKLTQFSFTKKTKKHINQLENYIKDHMPNFEANQKYQRTQTQRQISIMSQIQDQIKHIIKKIQNTSLQIKNFYRFGKNLINNVYRFGQNCTQFLEGKPYDVEGLKIQGNQQIFRNFSIQKKLQQKLQQQMQILQNIKILKVIMAKKQKQSNQTRHQEQISNRVNYKPTQKIIKQIIQLITQNLIKQYRNQKNLQSQLKKQLLSNLQIYKSLKLQPIGSEMQLNIIGQSQLLEQQNFLKQKDSKAILQMLKNQYKLNQKQLISAKQVLQQILNKKVLQMQQLIKLTYSIPQKLTLFCQIQQVLQRNQITMQSYHNIQYLRNKIEQTKKIIIIYLKQSQKIFVQNLQELQNQLCKQMQISLITVFDQLKQINGCNMQIAEQLLLFDFQQIQLNKRQQMNEQHYGIGDNIDQRNQDDIILNQFLIQFYLQNICEKELEKLNKDGKKTKKQYSFIFDSNLNVHQQIKNISKYQEELVTKVRAQIALKYQDYEHYYKCAIYSHTLNILKQLQGARKIQYKNLVAQYNKQKQKEIKDKKYQLKKSLHKIQTNNQSDQYEQYKQPPKTSKNMSTNQIRMGDFKKQNQRHDKNRQARLKADDNYSQTYESRTVRLSPDNCYRLNQQSQLTKSKQKKKLRK